MKLKIILVAMFALISCTSPKGVVQITMDPNAEFVDIAGYNITKISRSTKKYIVDTLNRKSLDGNVFRVEVPVGTYQVKYRCINVHSTDPGYNRISPPFTISKVHTYQAPYSLYVQCN